MNHVIITISGLPGSGTTTAAKLLEKRTDMKFISTGEIFRGLAKEKGFTVEEFNLHAEGDDKIDRELDENLVEMAKPGCILEGRLTGYLLYREDIEAYKVWLHAPDRVRAMRIADREMEGVKEIYDKMKLREKSEWIRYKQFYDIDLNDHSIYDLVIDSSDNTPQEIVERIIEGVKEWSL